MAILCGLRSTAATMKGWPQATQTASTVDREPVQRASECARPPMNREESVSNAAPGMRVFAALDDAARGRGVRPGSC